MQVSAEDSQRGVSGRSWLFWIPGPNGILGSKEIFSRLSPMDVTLCPEYGSATVFFIESRNLQKIPAQFKGVLCAIFMKGRSRKTGVQTECKWRLCICWKINPNRDSVHVFVWKGKTRPTNGSGGGAVPEFFSSLGNLALTNDFSFVTVRGENKNIVFLNQVNGERPGDSPYKFDQLNKRDKRFQCSLTGPDTLVFPVGANLLTRSTPACYPIDYLTTPTTKYSFEAAPLQKRYDWSKYCSTAVRPILPAAEKKRKSRPKKFPPWTAPPTIPTLEAVPYALVYVEDTHNRLAVEPLSKGLVAVPFLHLQTE